VKTGERFQKISIYRLDEGSEKEQKLLTVPSEHVIKLVLNYQDILELTCLNENLKEFIVGFLFTEGIIDNFHDIEHIEFSRDEKKVFVHTKDETKGNEYKDKLKRIVTGCHGGFVQGKITGVKRSLTKSINIDFDLIARCRKILERQSSGYKLTHCTHAACLFNLKGELLFKCEDLGRHNAVDKVVGHAVKEDHLGENRVIFVTGRISSEMVGKILRTGWIGIFSISSPTLDAIELCREYNILLIARIKNKGLNIYNQPPQIRIKGK